LDQINRSALEFVPGDVSSLNSHGANCIVGKAWHLFILFFSRSYGKYQHRLVNGINEFVGVCGLVQKEYPQTKVGFWFKDPNPFTQKKSLSQISCFCQRHFIPLRPNLLASKPFLSQTLQKKLNYLNFLFEFFYLNFFFFSFKLSLLSFPSFFSLSFFFLFYTFTPSPLLTSLHNV